LFAVTDSRTEVDAVEISPSTSGIESLKGWIEGSCSDFQRGGSGKNFFSIFDFFHKWQTME
jgi:hypothetical protein